jgi:hypothetical protein
MLGSNNMEECGSNIEYVKNEGICVEIDEIRRD